MQSTDLLTGCKVCSRLLEIVYTSEASCSISCVRVKRVRDGWEAEGERLRVRGWGRESSKCARDCGCAPCAFSHNRLKTWWNIKVKECNLEYVIAVFFFFFYRLVVTNSVFADKICSNTQNLNFRTQRFQKHQICQFWKKRKKKKMCTTCRIFPYKETKNTSYSFNKDSEQDDLKHLSFSLLTDTWNSVLVTKGTWFSVLDSL